MTSINGPVGDADGPTTRVQLSDEVARAKADGRPLVALESTIFSNLGLPSPSNREALDRVYRAILSFGAVPALTAVIGGVPRVGVDDSEHALICGPATKLASRDLAFAITRRVVYGATTVSASLHLAEAAGLRVFATGGIGGVHRGAELSGDVSADLPALARHRLVTVTAGAKVFLDLPKTIEYLETLSVPVIGFRCDEFPAFHARSSGRPLSCRIDDPAEIAEVAQAHWELGGGGLVVVNPVPEADALDYDELDQMVSEALASEEAASGAPGPSVTPRVLGRLAELSEGKAVAANLSLAEHNAQVAAQIALALASRS